MQSLGMQNTKNDIVVQKYGGTSVGSIERMKNVCSKIEKFQKTHQARLLVVVSAMSGQTNALLDLSAKIASQVNLREQDALISTGEMQSAAMMALMLNSMGIAAKSLMGFQIPIRTDSKFSKANIELIETKGILGLFDTFKVLVVAGFQGIDFQDNITTLGRGGSDLTAVALSCALGARHCEIYTDVSGVFSADPNVCQDARLLKTISYDEMLEFASLGAKVLQTRSVQMAKRYQMPVWVGSSFNDNNDQGTWLVKEESMESMLVCGVTLDRNDAFIWLRNIPKEQSLAKIFEKLSSNNISLDVIVQERSKDGSSSLSFSLPKQFYAMATELLLAMGIKEVDGVPKVAKVSAVGLGMKNNAGVAARIFGVLNRENIDVLAVSTSEIKISCIVEDKYAELAVRGLHDEFSLGKEPH